MTARKVLVVLGHPDPESFNAAIFHTYADAAIAAGHDVRTLALGALEFDPVLRWGYRARMAPDPVIERSQAWLLWAEHLVLVFPVWWSQMPALLKGWVDRTFTPGLAYNMKDDGLRAIGHLRGRSATLITTSQAPRWVLALTGLSPVWNIKHNLLGTCGIKTVRTLSLGRMTTRHDTAERRARFLCQVAQAGCAIR
jgi:putative NADPH-quinone reductase